MIQSVAFMLTLDFTPPAVPGSSPFERVSFVYPDGDLGWFPGGPTGVLAVFVLASMVFGVLVMKPLGIQI